MSTVYLHCGSCCKERKDAGIQVTKQFNFPIPVPGTQRSRYPCCHKPQQTHSGLKDHVAVKLLSCTVVVEKYMMYPVLGVVNYM